MRLPEQVNYRTANKLINHTSSDTMGQILLTGTTRVRHRKSLTVILLAAIMTLTGCGTWWLPRPHRIEIQQGNILTTDDLVRVENGMTKIEVINIIGKPITTSVFDDERWDYIYSLNRSGGKPDSKRFTVFFQNDKVYRVEDDGYKVSAEGESS